LEHEALLTTVNHSKLPEHRVTLVLNETDYELLLFGFSSRQRYSGTTRAPCSLGEYLVLMALRDAQSWQITAMESTPKLADDPEPASSFQPGVVR
jgi:hypothetical protein